MQRRYVTIGLAAAGLLAFAAADARAQEVVKIGMSFSMTGAGFNAAGRQARRAPGSMFSSTATWSPARKSK